MSLISDRHLGGCISGGDPDTYSPKLWDYIIDKYSIKSLVDIGCGEGYSTLYFHNKGVNVLGVDGFQTALDNFQVPGKSRLVDYQESSALNEFESFDLCWSCEFVEHVYEEFSHNFLKDFSRAKYLAVTHAVPGQPGYHHVNCREEFYWVDRIEARGFRLDRKETNIMRSLCDEGNYYGKTGLFFVNEKVL